MATLAEEIAATARGLGINPLDLATAISYETGGTFDPWQAGPTTKWGQHRGLIQMGEPQRAQYGYEQGAPLNSQMGAVARYLTDTGVKPGMGLLDIYSAINAGGVGRYDRSDAAAGGAPGTVRDKVEQQMGGHRAKAQALLGGPTIENAATLNNARNAVGGPTVENAAIVNSAAPAQPPPMAPPPQQGNPFANMMASMGSGAAPRAQQSGRQGFESTTPSMPFVPTEVNTRVQDPSMTSTSLQPLQGLLAPSLFSAPADPRMPPPKRPTRTPDTKPIR
jgi:hypothetical protein